MDSNSFLNILFSQALMQGHRDIDKAIVDIPNIYNYWQKNNQIFQLIFFVLFISLAFLFIRPKSDHCLVLSVSQSPFWILLKLLDLSKLRDVEKNPNVPTLTLSDGGVLRSYTWQRSGGLNQSKIYTRRILHLWPQFFSHTNTLIQGDQMKLSILIFAFLKLNVWNTRHKKMMMMVAAVVGKNVYRGVTWLSRDSTGRGR